MMTLLVPNNPNTVTNVLSALRQVLPAGTQLAAGTPSLTGVERIYDEQQFNLLQAAFPSVLLYGMPVRYLKQSRNTYTGVVDIVCVYYQRWDTSTSPQTLDSLWQLVAADLERMRANIESNDRLVLDNANSIQTVKKLSLSPYYGTVVPISASIITISRSMTISCVLPPFDS